jgi:hypothetical protein
METSCPRNYATTYRRVGHDLPHFAPPDRGGHSNNPRIVLTGSMGKENVIVLGSRPSDRIGSASTRPGLGDAPDILAVLTFVVVARLFGPGTSLSLGIVPDSQSPSGQVNRIVNRVTVHPYGGR